MTSINILNVPIFGQILTQRKKKTYHPLKLYKFGNYTYVFDNQTFTGQKVYWNLFYTISKPRKKKKTDNQIWPYKLRSLKKPCTVLFDKNHKDFHRKNI